MLSKGQDMIWLLQHCHIKANYIDRKKDLNNVDAFLATNGCSSSYEIPLSREESCFLPLHDTKYK